MTGSRFRQAHLAGGSRTGADPDELVQGQYDLMVLVSSWDARCLSITATQHARARRTVTVFFDLKDSLGLRYKHDAALTAFAVARGDKHITLTGNSIDIHNIWNKLIQAIVDSYQATQRPLRILLDISTCPRVYTTAILGAVFSRAMAYEVTLFYSQGEYATTSGSIPEAFTSGRWRLITVPGLNGRIDPGKERFYLISVGFEGSKTYQAVSEADPYRVSLLFPEPGYAQEYTHRAWEANAPLIRQYRIPNDQIIRAPAGDAVAAWRALADSPRERPANENTYYVCCGTKPHAIALALRAMALRYPAVVYYVPGEHRVIPTQSSGIFWSYVIRDMTALPSTRRAQENAAEPVATSTAP